MKIIFKCRCMKEGAEIDVSARRSDEDVLDWMAFVAQPSIGREHRRLSPLCRSQEMEYAKIPIDERADGVGMEPKLN